MPNNYNQARAAAERDGMKLLFCTESRTACKRVDPEQATDQGAYLDLFGDLIVDELDQWHAIPGVTLVDHHDQPHEVAS